MRPLAIASALAVAVLAAAAPAVAQPACGEVLTQDTTLEADMDCRGEPGLVIGAPDITLDLGGHFVNSFATAIRNDGHAGVTIRNGSVNGDTEAIRLNGVSGNTVRDLTVSGIVNGITLSDSDHNRVLSTTLRSAALRFDPGSDHNLARGNVLRGREGVLSGSGSHNRFIENIVWTGDDGAMGLYEADHSIVRRNAFVTSQAVAVTLTRADDNLLAENTFVQLEDYRGSGLEVVESDRNRFARNDFLGVPLGVGVRSGSGNVFTDNSLVGAVVPTFTGEADGFQVASEANGTELRGNSVQGFADDGIDVEAPGTLIRGNTANDNGDLGIEAVAGVVDGGGNSASGNGNPAQCAGVACAP
jgi:parallel beta-helix repeat protein